MKRKDKDALLHKIEYEGFSEAILQWSWEEIQDKKFHELRDNYKSSYKELEKYLDEQGVY